MNTKSTHSKYEGWFDFNININIIKQFTELNSNASEVSQNNLVINCTR